MIGKRNKKEHKPMKNTEAKASAQEETDLQDVKDNTSPGTGEEPVSAADSAQDVNEQVSELNDRYLRLYSDFDNYRKRTIKEKIELSKYATADVITKLLPVLDDFDRAIRAFDDTTEATKPLKDGIILIFNKFLSILNQQGLEQMRTAGESFDTDFHEAITNIPAASPEQKGKIVDEIEKGYMLNGKVIRYAKVVVGS